MEGGSAVNELRMTSRELEHSLVFIQFDFFNLQTLTTKNWNRKEKERKGN